MKKLLALCMAFMLLLAVVPVEASAAPAEGLMQYWQGLTEEEQAELIQLQNSMQNSYTYTVSSGWIYGLGVDEYDNISLVKWRTNFSDFTVLAGGAPSFLSVQGVFLYCMLDKNGPDSGIYRMRVSGSDPVKLSDAMGAMQIVGDTIYFTDAQRDYHLFKMDLDGKNEMEVMNKAIFHWFVFGDMILYQDDANGETLHLMKFGGEDVKLSQMQSYFPVFDGEYIYYVKTLRDVRSIWRVTVDGSKEELVARYPASEGFVLHGDRIYFVYADDEGRIYSVGKNGEDLQFVVQDAGCMHIQFLGSYLKYEISEADPYYGTLYLTGVKLCNEDGTLFRQLVS